MRPTTALSWSLMIGLAVAWSVRPAPLPRVLVDGPPASTASPETPWQPVSHAPSETDPLLELLTLPLAHSGESVTTITWAQLRGLDSRTGAVSSALRKLDGRKVRVPGFIVPLEDFQEVFKEFLLVPYFGACVHTPPPPANQMIYASASGRTVRAEWWAPVWLEGTLTITSYQSVYGVAGFRMTVDRITPYRQE